jgi:hypothetical protein
MHSSALDRGEGWRWAADVGYAGCFAATGQQRNGLKHMIKTAVGILLAEKYPDPSDSSSTVK